MLMYLLIILPIVFLIYYYNNKFNEPPKLIRQKAGL